MTATADTAPQTPATCHFPGCTRTITPGGGHRAKYCEQTVDGVAHNRVNAWHRRRAQASADAPNTNLPADRAAASAPVSAARQSLEQRLAQLPGQIAAFTKYLGDMLADIHAAGDTEAAAAEVQDAHRQAQAAISQAEHRAALAERAARQAQAQAAAAQTQREQADAVAEDALTQTEHARKDFQQQLAQACEQTAAAQQAHQVAQDSANQQRIAAEDARRALQHAHEQAHTERQALRAEHAEHIRQLRQAADEHTAALRTALDIAQQQTAQHHPPNNDDAQPR
jgi:chromosome segregation ATPase